MKSIKFGEYELLFENGGISIFKNNEILYFNKRPIYVSVKNIGAVSIFGESTYSTVEQISEQVYFGNYHWLPWCTFVEVDPVSRMVDTFGVYEIADAEKLPLEDRQKRNKILETYYK